MSNPIVIIAIILGFAAALLIAWILRLQRRSREIEKSLDYSKMKKWKDDDED